MKTSLRLQETETIGSSGLCHTLTGTYTLVGKIQDTDHILIECPDTHELFIINNNLNLY